MVPGGPLRRRYLGSWSRLGGLEIVAEDTWQRRRDLEGLQLSVATDEVSASTHKQHVTQDFDSSAFRFQ